MKKRLKEIRETQRPCLEACLRFLLFADGGRGQKPTLDSGTDSEDDVPDQLDKGKDLSTSVIPNHPNLAEPRSTQGVFGPNGKSNPSRQRVYSDKSHRSTRMHLPIIASAR